MENIEEKALESKTPEYWVEQCEKRKPAHDEAVARLAKIHDERLAEMNELRRKHEEKYGAEMELLSEYVESYNTAKASVRYHTVKAFENRVIDTLVEQTVLTEQLASDPEVRDYTLRVTDISKFNVDKKIIDGKLSAKVITDLEYDESAALKWAIEHKMALSLDKKAFEKIITTGELPVFVVKKYRYTAVLSKTV